MISSRYHSHIIQITPTYYPFITHISSRYHLYITNLIQISPTYHSNIIRVSPTYGPNITRYFLQPHNLMKSRVLTQIWHTYCRKKTPLWNLIITPLLIIQILPKYYPKIIQKSSRYHPVDINFYNPPTWWKVEFSSRYGTTFAGENSIKILEGKSQVLLNFYSNFCLLGWDEMNQYK